MARIRACLPTGRQALILGDDSMSRVRVITEAQLNIRVSKAPATIRVRDLGLGVRV